MKHDAGVLRIVKVNILFPVIVSQYQPAEGSLPWRTGVDRNLMDRMLRSDGVREVRHGRKVRSIAVGITWGRELAKEGFFDLLEGKEAESQCEKLGT